MFNSHTNYLVHDENAACRTGDIVRIEAGTGVSRRKRHTVSQIITPFGDTLEERHNAVETNEERTMRKLNKRADKLVQAMEIDPGWLKKMWGLKLVKEKPLREELMDLLKAKKII